MFLVIVRVLWVIFVMLLEILRVFSVVAMLFLHDC